MQLERTPRKRGQRNKSESGEASLCTLVLLSVCVVVVLWFALFRGDQRLLGVFGIGGNGGSEVGGDGGNTKAELRRYE